MLFDYTNYTYYLCLLFMLVGYAHMNVDVYLSIVLTSILTCWSPSRTTTMSRAVFCLVLNDTPVCHGT